MNINLGIIAEPAAAQRAQHPALMDFQQDSYPRVRSFRTLAQNSDRVANFFVAAGMERGSRVLLIMKNRIEYVETLLGILKAGLVAVPVHYGAGSARIRAILEDVQPAISIDLVSDCESMQDSSVLSGIFGSREIIDFRETYSSPPDTVAKCVSPTDIATIVYTSGSTGVPKGVAISHYAAVQPIRKQYDGRPRFFDFNQKSLIALPLNHELAFASLKLMLSYGGTSVLLDHFEPRTFYAVMNQEYCTSTVLVPSMVPSLLDEVSSGTPPKHLHTVAVGGAPFNSTLATELSNKLPQTRIVQLYGMTECGNVFVQRYRDGSPTPIDSLGVPAPGVDVKIGSDDDTDLGELYVRTSTMMDGYINGPKSISTGWLATGDIFKRIDGLYYFHGRKDDMFVSGGENVYPCEIEQVIARHPNVLSVCVFAQPHEIKGHVPVAVVCIKGKPKPTAADLLKFANKHLPKFLRLSSLHCVDKLPLTPVGKIDVLKLAQLFSQQGN